ncbi:MAG: DUF488 domain-containing protein [Chloroherpetonaceae bacterium]
MLFTIGHSTHRVEVFVERLHAYQITCLIDVRSSPYSRICPQFNKPVLSKILQAEQILYAHMPDELGARRTEKAFLDADGKVDFEKVRNSTLFKRGVERVKNGLVQGFQIGLMCAEANPMDCHRFSLIARGFSDAGVEVQHILKDGSLISNELLEEDLLAMYRSKLPTETLFSPAPTREELLSIAYKLRNKDVAFSSLHQEEETDK